MSHRRNYLCLRAYKKSFDKSIIALVQCMLKKGAMSQETGLEVPRCWPQYKRACLRFMPATRAWKGCKYLLNVSKVSWALLAQSREPLDSAVCPTTWILIASFFGFFLFLFRFIYSLNGWDSIVMCTYCMYTEAQLPFFFSFTLSMAQIAASWAIYTEVLLCDFFPAWSTSAHFSDILSVKPVVLAFDLHNIASAVRIDWLQARTERCK